MTRVNNILTALLAVVAAFTMGLMTAAAQQQMPQTTKEITKGPAAITTEQLNGTVDYVEGNTLVVRMTNGSIREFSVPESRKFIIDGRELTVHELKPGTKLSATVTTTTTPVTERTTTVGTGTVWWVAGKTVILTLPNGENREYTVKSDYKFRVDGKDATVSDLRKGMRISAEKIVEEPRTEITSNTVVTGQAPPPPVPKAVVAQTPPPAPKKEVAQARPAPPPTPTPEPTPVQLAQAQPARTPEPAPVQLPRTGSPLPLVGVLGLIFTVGGLALRKMGQAGNI